MGARWTWGSRALVVSIAFRLSIGISLSQSEVVIDWDIAGVSIAFRLSIGISPYKVLRSIESLDDPSQSPFGCL